MAQPGQLALAWPVTATPAGSPSGPQNGEPKEKFGYERLRTFVERVQRAGAGPLRQLQMLVNQAVATSELVITDEDIPF